MRATIHPPSGCRWCGIEEREHASRFTSTVGQHLFVEPTTDQRLGRMRDRRSEHRDSDRPETCREHLGRELGYCDGAIQTRDVNGRGFCVEHAKERGF